MAVLSALHPILADELHRQRAQGQPFKAAFASLARRINSTPRRVRALYHREVRDEDVRAAEWLAVMELRDARRREEIARARALLAGEAG